MSTRLTLSGTTSILKAEYFPPLHGEYELGLIGFQAWNNIANVTEKNNVFHYNSTEEIEIPVGCYQLNDIEHFLVYKMYDKHRKNSVEEGKQTKQVEKLLILTGNRQTLKTELECQYQVDFTRENSIGTILGFDKVVLEPFQRHESSKPSKLTHTESIRIECDGVKGSFRNQNSTHTLHEFFITVPPGFQICEVPSHVIYLPTTNNIAHGLELRICNQNGDLLDFRGETCVIILHLRPRNAYNL